MTPHFISVLDNLSVATYEGGDPAGLPLFFLHGNSLAADIFARQFKAPELQHFRLVAFDLPGHGQSPPAPGHYGLGAMRATVLAAVQKLGLEQAVAVGHSYGGHLLLELLPNLPSLQGLVAIAPPVSTLADMEAAFPISDTRLLFYTSAITSSEAEAMARYALGPLAPASLVALLEADVLRTDGRIRSELTASIGELGDEVGNLHRTAVPLAFVTGEQDHSMRLPYFDTLMAPSRWGPSQHLIPGAGHSPFLENPLAFNTLLLQFVAATARRGAAIDS
ncbi:alpha/beta hydrolase (plasmid) [Hymenobacter tibetensis]|uniref:Alpha/beta hydrolase n=1 Tax=Hymenobacter tibetensis TaxID=497967 RepID=A0ABY4D4Z1_9BACT|nr:alpha/beta hydrolase [Hymenobacter tibetensis]UOG77428.1 alpha/beta hydrolase [Hymenobacter tibetensis]